MKKLKRILLWIICPAAMAMAMAYDEYDKDRVMDEDYCVIHYLNGNCTFLEKGTKHRFRAFRQPIMWTYLIDGEDELDTSWKKACDKSHEE